MGFLLVLVDCYPTLVDGLQHATLSQGDIDQRGGGVNTEFDSISLNEEQIYIYIAHHGDRFQPCTENSYLLML